MDVKFDEDHFGSRNGNPGTLPQAHVGKDPIIAAWLINSGLVKDAHSANILLTILSLVMFAASIYFLVFGFSRPQALGPQNIQEEAVLPIGLEN